VDPKSLPFHAKRMIYGGFESLEGLNGNPARFPQGAVQVNGD
jgi:hypothetical protein